MPMDTTPNLALPYLMAAQAQKHVTHNEAIRMLDALVQPAVLDRHLASPPASPAEGDRYIVAAAATGAWAGHEGAIAAFQDGAWAVFAPRQGWTAWIADEAVLVAWDGAAWITAGGGGSVNPTPLVGVNATADATNRLSVAAPATLLNHEGDGHQLKINKAAAADTASLLYQTAFSGRAEMGLAGDDNFHVKVSPDGTTWYEAMLASRTSGNVAFGTTSVLFPLNVGGDTNGSAKGPVWAEAKTAGGIGVALTLDASPATGGHSYSFLATGPSASPGAGHFAFFDGTANVYRMILTGAGKVGIGTIAPDAGHLLDVNGAIRCTSLTQTSDARLKEVIGPSLGLAFLRKLEPITFRWRDQAASTRTVVAKRRVGGAEREVQEEVAVTGPKPTRPHQGLLAQQVKAAADALGIDFGGYKQRSVKDPGAPEEHSLDYAQLIAPLVRAVQELADRLERLEGPTDRRPAARG